MVNDITQQQKISELNNDEVDLYQLVASLVRQKKLVAGIAGSALLISGIYAFNLDPVWKGGFQIVLEQDNNNQGNRLAQLAAGEALFSNLVGMQGSTSKKLKTEVTILESPSVLKPIFDFVKATKAQQGLDVGNWRFTAWRKANLDISLEKGTSVLNLTYQDTNKDLVLPVLKRITETYQNYSNRDNLRTIDNALTFTKKQVIILQSKAKESNIALDTFKFTYGISDDVNQTNLSQLDKLSSPLPQANIGFDPLSELGSINKEITRRLQFFTTEDPSIKRLKQERKAILQYIEQTGGGLISIAGGGSKEKNREILLQYKALQRKALRDSTALTAIESELLSLQIQKAQTRQPWELISTPTLIDTPVAPQKRRIMTFGLLAGLIVGSGAALFNDRRTGLVFSEDELQSAISASLLERLSLHSNYEWGSSLQLLAQGPLKKAQSIGLVPVGQPDSPAIQQLQNQLKIAIGTRKIVLSEDLVKTRNCDTQLLLIQPGCISRKQIEQLNQSLSLQGTPVAGWILIGEKIK